MSSRSVKPYLWVLGLLWALPAFVVAIGYVVLPKDVGGGQCEGLGFGCTPSPADGLVLLGMMSVTVLVPLGVVAVAVIALVQWLRGRRERSVDGVTDGNRQMREVD